MRRARERMTVVGLDLSLRGPAAVAIRPGWRHDWSREKLVHARWPYEVEDQSPLALVRRLDRICDDVVQFIASEGCGDKSDVAVYVENYAFSASSTSVTRLAELGGAARLELYRSLGMTMRPVPVSTARKLFLGHCPKGAKQMVQAELAGLDAPFASDDECDAFAVANWGRADLGMPAMTLQLAK